MLLAGDLGGTKTKLAVYSLKEGPALPLYEVTYPSAQFDGFEQMLQTFLDACEIKVETACFGVAGPVVDGACDLTNLPWQLDEQKIQKALGLEKVKLLNDLVAIAYSVPILGQHELISIHTGIELDSAPKAIIAPGTGLGEAFLTWGDSGYDAHASEGGHVEFGPRSKLELELLSFLMEKHHHVSYELICSGIGLPNIFEFLVQVKGLKPDERVISALAIAKDPTPVLVKAAMLTQSPCPVCQQALEMFVSILGAEAGNLALKVVARGGVYLGGGISIAIQQILQQGSFFEAFKEKGRLSKVLNDVPISIIIADDAGIRGAAYYGLNKLG